MKSLGGKAGKEGRGFEPLRTHALTVFKTVAIDHSAIPPGATILPGQGKILP